MAEDAQESDRAAFIETLYGEVLRERTVKTAKHLNISGAMTIMVVAFGLKIKSTPWMPIEFGDRQDALSMFLAASTLSLTIIMAMRVSIDLMLFRENWFSAAKYISAQKVEWSRQCAASIDDMAYDRSDEEPPPDDWWENHYHVAQREKGKLDKMTNRINRRGLPIAVRFVVLITEALGPLLIGGFALWLARGALAQFASEVGHLI